MPLWGTRYVGLYWLVSGLRDSEDAVTHNWPSMAQEKLKITRPSGNRSAEANTLAGSSTGSIGVPEYWSVALLHYSSTP